MNRKDEQIKMLLFEAFRRNQICDTHERSKLLKDRWLGLGTAAAYAPAVKAGVMKFIDRTPPPRIMGWLVLTDKGITMMADYSMEFAATLAEMKKRGYDFTLHARFQLVGGLTKR